MYAFATRLFLCTSRLASCSLYIGIHLGRSCMFSFLEVKWIDLWSLWSRIATYTMEFMEVNIIKIRLYSLEVVGWVLKDIKLIREQFVSIYFLFLFLFLLRCNCVVLALISVAACKREWEGHYFKPLFTFSIVYHDIEWIKSTIVSSKKKI